MLSVLVFSCGLLYYIVSLGVLWNSLHFSLQAVFIYCYFYSGAETANLQVT